MGLDLPGLFRDTVVPIADQVFGSARLTIGLERVTGSNAFGPIYAASVPVLAAVALNPTQKAVASQDGTEHVFAASLQFIGPVAIKERDRVTMPSGVKATVIAVGGELDPATGAPYAPIAYTGKV